MLLKALLVSTSLLSGSFDSPSSNLESPVATASPAISAVSGCATSEVGEATATSSSSCAQAQAAYAAAYDEYYYALNNTQAAVQTYNMCLGAGGDCTFWYENMISWSNYLGETEYALMDAAVNVWIYCEGA
jgi:hypothetical protein